MAVAEITSITFQSQVLDAKKLVLIDLWAPWCGPCHMQSPIVEELAEEVGDKIVVGKLNVDENVDIASKYGIMSIPTIMIFKDGEVVERLVGVHQKEDLLSYLAKHS